MDARMKRWFEIVVMPHLRNFPNKVYGKFSPRSGFPTVHFGRPPPDALRNAECVEVDGRDLKMPTMFADKKTQFAVRVPWRSAGLRRTKNAKAGAPALIWASQAFARKLGTLMPHQWLNRFGGAKQLGDKARMARSLQAMKEKHPEAGIDAFNPTTFVLPDDKAAFLAFVAANPKMDWIYKPAEGSCGKGIFVFPGEKAKKAVAAARRRHAKKPGSKVVVQEYVEGMHVKGRKFDLRLYVLVTSLDPLVMYRYVEGIVRYAAKKHTKNAAANFDKRVHLTNSSIPSQPRNSSKRHGNRKRGRGGSKRRVLYLFRRWTNRKGSIRWLNAHLRANGKIDPRVLWPRIDTVIVKTALSALESMQREEAARKEWQGGNCFAILGFDIMLDREGNPQLMEVNLKPSLKSTEPLDYFTKKHALEDALNILHIPFLGLTPPGEPLGDGCATDGRLSDGEKSFNCFINQLRWRGGWLPIYPRPDVRPECAALEERTPAQEEFHELVEKRFDEVKSYLRRSPTGEKGTTKGEEGKG